MTQMEDVTNEADTLTAYIQRVVTGLFLFAVVAAQTYLTRKRTCGKDVGWRS